MYVLYVQVTIMYVCVPKSFFFFLQKSFLGEDIEPRIPRDEDMDYDDQEA